MCIRDSDDDGEPIHSEICSAAVVYFAVRPRPGVNFERSIHGLQHGQRRGLGTVPLIISRRGTAVEHPLPREEYYAALGARKGQATEPCHRRTST